jgi:aldehyde dehydrogenase (NAD+)
MSTPFVTTQELTAQEARAIMSAQRAYFKAGHTRPYRFRRKQLRALRQAIIDREEALFEALHKDFRKSKFETYATEIAFTIAELDIVLKGLENWMQPQSIPASLLNFPSSDQVQFDPYGLSLIIAPWNYPFQLAIAPLIGTLAAGNCAVVKPSENTPHTSALIQEMIEDIFPPEYVKVIQGEVPTSTVLLAQKWDKIFFTGSPAVGKIVAQAAAKHLTPVTLELGGKSPCIVDETADIKLAAKRIAWGKYLNGGQTCIAPDYLLVHPKIKDQLIQEIGKQIESFYGADPQASEDYPRIINRKNFDRLARYLKSGTIALGGETDPESLYIAPTVLDEVSWDDLVMEDEIFGPILPVLTYDDLDEAVEAINERTKPLALYIFSSRTRRQEKILKETTSGGVCVNDTISHIVNPKLPFGGVGNSGQGAYHGRHSFEVFSHKKSISKRGTWFDLPLRYAPYKGKIAWIRRAFKWMP